MLSTYVLNILNTVWTVDDVLGTTDLPSILLLMVHTVIISVKCPDFLKIHKKIKKSLTCFDATVLMSKQLGDFFKFCGLLRKP